MLPALLLQYAVLQLPAPLALVILACLASTLIAQRSLYEHVAAVADALDKGGVEAGREAVAKIVGRDTRTLDEAGVARSAIESLAENFSDGVVAPIMWGAVLGLPGMVAYKAINTADSMIGHRTQRHEAFGFAAAKVDDAVNIPASRLAAFFLALATSVHDDADFHRAVETVRRDADTHRSPNAGWPEAAMAGALGLKLSGPRVYHGALTDDEWIGDGREEANSTDIRRALGLYKTACTVQIVALGLVAVFIVTGLSPHGFAMVFSVLLFIIGTVLATDGVLGLRSGMDRTGKRLRLGRSARVVAGGKLAAGAAAILLLCIGLTL